MKFTVFFLLIAAVVNVGLLLAQANAAATAATQATKPTITPTKPSTSPPIGSEKNPKRACPSDNEIEGCSCYPVLLRISCDSTIKKFNLSVHYQIDTLFIFNAPNLTTLVDKTIAHGTLKVESLILRYDNNTEAITKIPSMDLVQEVLSVSTKNVKIIATDKVKGSLDMGDFAKGLSSLIIEDVNNLINLDYDQLSGLNHLTILNSNLENNNLNVFLPKSSIKYIEIENTNIVGFSFKPATCDRQQIFIKIRNNKSFKNFEFSSLIISSENTENCNYHIDLSGNPVLDTNTFNKEKQLDTIKAFYKGQNINLYLVMRGDTLTCSCDFFKNVYLNHVDKIHGLKCTTKNKATPPKPIDELKMKDFDPNECK